MEKQYWNIDIIVCLNVKIVPKMLSRIFSNKNVRLTVSQGKEKMKLDIDAS